MRRLALISCVVGTLGGCGLTGDSDGPAPLACSGTITDTAIPPCFDDLLGDSGLAVCEALVTRASAQFVDQQRRVEQPKTPIDGDGRSLSVVEAERVEIRDGELVTPPREVDAAVGDNVFVPIVNDRCATPFIVGESEGQLGFGANTLFFAADQPGDVEITLAGSEEPLLTLHAE